jgi:hypothetical protein
LNCFIQFGLLIPYLKLRSTVTSLVVQPDCDTRFQELLQTDFSTGELAAVLSSVGRKHQPHLITLIADPLLALLCDASFDFSAAFPDLKLSHQTRLLRRLLPSAFGALAAVHRSLLTAKEDRLEVFVVRKCIEGGVFVRAMKFLSAADADFCELLTEKKELTTAALKDCISITTRNTAEWGSDHAILEVLGHTFPSQSSQIGHSCALSPEVMLNTWRGYSLKSLP